MTDTYTRAGKQVLRNGCHFVDACDEAAAEMIVSALKAGGLMRGLKIQIDTHIALGRARDRQFAKCREMLAALPDKFAAYLDAEAEKSPRARVRARTLRVMADNVRAGLWSKDDDQGGEG